jgi:hypothetical protein
MKLDLIECTVRLNYDGNPNLTEVVKAGPGALRATDIPVLRAIHDLGSDAGDADCCIFGARVIGSIEVTQGDEMERLRATYPKEVLAYTYPGGRGLPQKLRDLELPEDRIAAVAAKSDRAEAVEKVA